MCIIVLGSDVVQLVPYGLAYLNHYAWMTIELETFFHLSGLGREYALAFAERGASVVGKVYDMFQVPTI